MAIRQLGGGLGRTSVWQPALVLELATVEVVGQDDDGFAALVQPDLAAHDLVLHAHTVQGAGLAAIRRGSSASLELFDRRAARRRRTPGTRTGPAVRRGPIAALRSVGLGGPARRDRYDAVTQMTRAARIHEKVVETVSFATTYHPFPSYDGMLVWIATSSGAKP